MHPVYGIFDGWSLFPQFSRYEIQHESGTKRFLFERINASGSFVVNHVLFLHSSKRSEPQHLY